MTTGVDCNQNKLAIILVFCRLSWLPSILLSATSCQPRYTKACVCSQEKSNTESTSILLSNRSTHSTSQKVLVTPLHQPHLHHISYTSFVHASSSQLIRRSNLQRLARHLTNVENPSSAPFVSKIQSKLIATAISLIMQPLNPTTPFLSLTQSSHVTIS